jgi:hypothetical protein
MKKFKSGLFLFVFLFVGSLMAHAQETNSSSMTIHIPEGYTQLQGFGDDSPGVASYSVDETEELTDDGSASWRSYRSGETEELRVYSGKQDGNNIITTVEVKIPPSMITDSYW